MRYSVAVLRRDDEAHGYAVYRHLREPQGRVTQIVDFLVDPADERGLKTLLRWIDREARAEDSDKIRCYVQHARVPPRAAALGVLRRQVGRRCSTPRSTPCRCRRISTTQPTAGTSRWGDGDLDH